MTPLKAMIVDDEWLVRSELKTLLAEFPAIQVVGEASNIRQAAEEIRTLGPDIIFLDVQMPGGNGFDLLNAVDVRSKIIFITAFDQYAIRAFEVNAIDYLLKPINKGRLQKSVRRLLQDESGNPKPSKVQYDDVIYITVNGALKFIKVSQLECITAEGNYSFIHCADRKKDLVAKTLQEWEDILPAKYFVRIHRSAIINFQYVENVKKCRNYTQQIYLKNMEKPFVMSRRYAFKLKHLLSW
jgi:two-component system, LytTR family, response regulator